MSEYSGIPGIVETKLLRGELARHTTCADLLIEVPHGATRCAHYDALRSRLKSQLPPGLEAFFFVNTDSGAWSLANAIAAQIVASAPTRSVQLLRCLLPRTFVDTNRTLDIQASDLTAGGLTAAIPSYVRDPADIALLIDLHQQYLAHVAQAWTAVLDSGGLAVIPHSYGPVSLGIATVDDTIVYQLRAAHEPEAYARWPRRPEIDLITRTADGRVLAPVDAETELAALCAASGLTAACNATYTLHAGTLAANWSERYPGRVLCFEVRRDLLVEAWTWDREMTSSPADVTRCATPFATYLDRWLRRRAR